MLQLVYILYAYKIQERGGQKQKTKNWNTHKFQRLLLRTFHSVLIFIFIIFFFVLFFTFFFSVWDLSSSRN